MTGFFNQYTHITFRVYGIPAPQGSKRSLGNGIMVESSLRVKPWREDVKQAAWKTFYADAKPGEYSDWLPFDGPVFISFEFLFPRPKSHFGTGKNASKLKSSAPYFVTSQQKGDLEKLMRSTNDALSVSSGGCVLHDDRLVAQTTAVKRYCDDKGELPGAIIKIEALPSC